MSATHETPESLSEVGGAGAVEEEARREVAVVEELYKLLPDERVQRHLVGLVAQLDHERVDAKRVAGQVEGDEDGRDDQEGLGDAQLGLVATGQHAPRPRRRRCRARRRLRDGAVTSRRGTRGRSP